MRTVCFIQARLKSERLPGKILMDLAGKPLLQHVCDRAARIPGVDAVYILTAKGCARAIRKHIRHPLTLFWAHLDENDVFGRFYHAAKETHPDYIVRITGDCPLLDPAVGGLVLAEAKRHQTYATNDTRVSGYPDGYDVQAFPIAWLHAAAAQPLSRHDREHVCTWMDTQPGARIVYAPAGYRPPYPGKLSVDTVEDLTHMRSLLTHEHRP